MTVSGELEDSVVYAGELVPDLGYVVMDGATLSSLPGLSSFYSMEKMMCQEARGAPITVNFSLASTAARKRERERERERAHYRQMEGQGEREGDEYGGGDDERNVMLVDWNG
ncbi:hypothetical protein RIF29_00768 [Crotalaria pallida]|uniref:Uncharacterized protein n=1 Tax=Crotalaria pallida TaxID=3830 RepID=A0AAN9IX33_CROPI